MAKKGDGLLKKTGNFRIFKRIDRHGDWIIIESQYKNWQLRFRDDNEMYFLIMSVLNMKEEITDAYIERFVVSCYMHTNHLHDWLCIVNGGEKKEDGDAEYLPFMNAYWKLIDEEVAREVSYADKPTEKEEEEALKSAVLMHELTEEMSKDQNEA